MTPDDGAIRLAAFRFLEEQTKISAEDGALSRATLAQGFTYRGDRVPLVGPSGIFKPRVATLPLSITTKAMVEGEARPYDDVFADDGLLRYRYRGTDPSHHDNVGLRCLCKVAFP